MKFLKQNHNQDKFSLQMFLMECHLASKSGVPFSSVAPDFHNLPPFSRSGIYEEIWLWNDYSHEDWKKKKKVNHLNHTAQRL